MPGVALVTGGGSGLGKAIAKRLARDGTSVVVAGRRKERLDSVVEELQADGAAALAVGADVSDERSVGELVSAAVDFGGRLDTVVSNAGVLMPGTKVTETPVEDWRTTLDINLTGTFLLSRAFRTSRECADR